ncbi:hypothetical protein BCR32DRAFT_271726 [Anaeromyces robustus]|uniref:Uncharacterized protein n=1 Tax=Anaeromyces robustus TaxID=1754192 RepID=A0A1Y1WQB4_9FUNG|nr:hypothetical protein BCR32DRAFT_271726 [Anaeromyces robustus]|eukprot:ORX75723.1 hypothetical protein BCR32DRAFT_271726 [Anaeromyces robustus]
MPNDEKIYPISSEEEQLINAPETAYVNTRGYDATQMPIPYADQQSSGSYQAPANPDTTAYTNPFTNTTQQFTTNTYNTTTQYSNAQNYPVQSSSNNTPVKNEETDRDAASSLCTLCCGLTLCTTLFTCCLGCCRCCCCNCGDLEDME